MAHSPYTSKTAEFVGRNPGCTKMALAVFLTWHPRRSPTKQWHLIDTQIRLGTIRAVWRGHKWALYLPDDKCYLDITGSGQ